jgi:hypothetical protein
MGSEGPARAAKNGHCCRSSGTVSRGLWWGFNPPKCCAASVLAEQHKPADFQRVASPGCPDSQWQSARWVHHGLDVYRG